MAGLRAGHPESHFLSAAFLTLDGRVKPAHGEEMNYSSRFWLYAPIALFLLIAAATMIHWWMAADAFEKKLAALKGHRAIPGVTIDWGSDTVGGFPFRVDATFTNLHIHGAGAHGPFAWKSEKFALHTLTYGAAKAVYEAAGQQQASWTDAGGGAHSASFLPASMRGSSIADPAGLRRFDLDIIGMDGNGFTVGRFQFHMRRDPDGADLDLMLKADGLKTQGPPKNLQVYATLGQAKALATVLAGEMAWSEADANWKAQGGTAKLSQVIAPGLVAGEILTPLY
jgi:hypothetical protein